MKKSPLFLQENDSVNYSEQAGLTLTRSADKSMQQLKVQENQRACAVGYLMNIKSIEDV